MPYQLRLTSYLTLALFLLGSFFLLQPKTTQTSTTENKVVEVSSNNSQVLGSSAQKYWKQTNFTGGINQGPYIIPFNNGTSSWSSYSSQTGMTIDGDGIKSTDGSTGELISSIFDQGSYRSHVACGYNDGYTCRILIRGGNSLAEILNVAWSDPKTCPTPYRYLQYKIVFPIDQYLASTPINQVTFTGQLQIISGYVTNSKTGVGVNGVKVTVDGSSFITETNPVTKKPGYYSIPIGFITDGAASLTASYSGYKTTSKNFNTNTDSSGCSKDIDGSVVIEPTTSGVGTQTSSQPEVPAIKKSILPSGFTQEGSTTTDLSQVENPAKIPNLTLEIPKKNKIVFAEDVDLTGQSASDVFGKLDTYVKVDKIGVVDIDSKNAPFLNKKAHIVMYNLTHKSTPKVLVDGKENPKVVSNIVYSKGTLEFDVAHFTKFEAVANTQTIATTSTKTTSNNNLFYGISFIGLGIIVFGGGYLIYKKKKLAKPSA